jgi:hypothetical protein
MINTAQTLFLLDLKHQREFANIYDQTDQTSITQTAIADRNIRQIIAQLPNQIFE